MGLNVYFRHLKRLNVLLFAFLGKYDVNYISYHIFFCIATVAMAIVVIASPMAPFQKNDSNFGDFCLARKVRIRGRKVIMG